MTATRQMPIRRDPAHLLVALLAFVVLALAACGGEEEDGPASAGNGVDLAFIDDMIPHHRGAVSMAQVAASEGRSDYVKGLAGQIIETQDAEIAKMRELRAEMAAEGVEKGSLGARMSMEGMDGASLRGATPFDREFVDKMIPHHQDAIVMARIVLDKGENERLKALAQQIIDGQAREITEMNRFREREFGAASPAGAVPAAGAQGGHSSGHG